MKLVCSSAEIGNHGVLILLRLPYRDEPPALDVHSRACFIPALDPLFSLGLPVSVPPLSGLEA